MPSPALLQQISLALAHALPLVPLDIKDRLESIHTLVAELGDEVGDAQAVDLLVEMGKMEWPYRRAYRKIAQEKASEKTRELLLEALEPVVRTKAEEAGVNDVPFAEWCASRLFEERFTPEERVQIEQAWEKAEQQTQQHVLEQIAPGGPWHAEYQQALDDQKKQQTEIETALINLTALVAVDEHWGPEIQAQVDRFREGWSVIERDVELAEVQHALEYWKGMLTVGE